MFILIDIICVASLVYLYIEKRNEKKKMQAQHSSNVLNPLVPQAPRLCGIFVSPHLPFSKFFPVIIYFGINPLGITVTGFDTLIAVGSLLYVRPPTAAWQIPRQGIIGGFSLALFPKEDGTIIMHGGDVEINILRSPYINVDAHCK